MELKAVMVFDGQGLRGKMKFSVENSLYKRYCRVFHEAAAVSAGVSKTDLE